MKNEGDCDRGSEGDAGRRGRERGSRRAFAMILTRAHKFVDTLLVKRGVPFSSRARAESPSDSGPGHQRQHSSAWPSLVRPPGSGPEWEAQGNEAEFSCKASQHAPLLRKNMHAIKVTI